MKFSFVVCLTLIFQWNSCKAFPSLGDAVNDGIKRVGNEVENAVGNAMNKGKENVENVISNLPGNVEDTVKNIGGMGIESGVKRAECLIGSCGNHDSPNPPSVNNNEEHKPVEVYHPPSFEIPQSRNRYQSSSNSNEKSEEVQPEPKSNNVVPSAEPENTGSQQKMSLTAIIFILCTWISI